MEHYIFVFASFLPKKRACACQTSRVPMPRVLVDQDVKCGMKERRIIDTPPSTPPGSGHDRFSCVSIHRRIENKAHNQYPSIFLHARSFLPCLPNLLSNCLCPQHTYDFHTVKSGSYFLSWFRTFLARIIGSIPNVVIKHPQT